MRFEECQFGVTVSRDSVGSFDADEWGQPEWNWHKDIKLWFNEYDVDYDYWFPEDPSLIVIDFVRRGQAAIFMSLFQ